MSSMKTTIKQIAIDLFYQKGYFATSISEIAHGCGIQKASIYYHFPGKEDLLFSIMDATMNELLSCLQRSQDSAAGIEARMRAAVRSHVTFHLEHQKETFIAKTQVSLEQTPHFRHVNYIL